jgi:hypothetical protein
MEIGNPTSGGQRKKKNYFYINQGSNVYRILPPMGSLAKDGIWSRYYEIHFGYVNKEGFMRPFQSCEVKSRDRKMIEIDDPATERIKRWDGQLNAIKERMKTAPSAELKVAQESLESLTGFNGQYNLEKRHYMNAINDKGEIGLLALKHKEKLALEEALKKFEAKYGFKAHGVEGAYLEFSKSGKGRETLVQVTPHMILKADQSETINRHTVDQAVINRLKDEAFELDKLYVALSREEIQAIVDASEADLKAGIKEGKKGREGVVVSEIFAKYEPARPARDNKPAEQAASQRSEAVKEDKKPESAPAPDLSMVEQAPAAPATPPAQAASSTVTQTATSTPPPAAQSDDDFLKSIGVPT